MPDQDEKKVSKPRIYKTKKEVFEYLKSLEKYKISRSQFYEHCKDRLLKPERDGTYTKKGVKKYTRHLVLLATGNKDAVEHERKLDRKLDLEIREREIRLEEASHKMETRKGRYIKRADHSAAIVARLVAMVAHLNHMIQVSVPDWIDLVGGDQKSAPELVDAISTEMEQRLSDFAADVEFDIILEKNE